MKCVVSVCLHKVQYDVKKKVSVFTHSSGSPLGADSLVFGLDRHPVACSRGIQAGGELGWSAEVQRRLHNSRGRIGGDKRRHRMGWSQGHRLGRFRFGNGCK